MLAPRYRPPIKPPPGAAHLNGGDPLARGLQACWVFNEGSGATLHDLVGQHRAALTVSTWGARVGGIGPLFTSSTYATMANPQRFDQNNITIAAGVRFFSLSTHRIIIDTLWSEDAHGFQMMVAGGTTWQWVSGSGTAPNPVTSATPAPAVDTEYHLVGTAKAGEQLLYLNGGLLGSAAFGSIHLTPIHDVIIGLNRVLGAGMNDHILYYLYIWDRVLPAGEIRRLAMNPYTFLAPTRSRVAYFLPAAPAAGRIFVLAGQGGGLVGEPRGLVA